MSQHSVTVWPEPPVYQISKNQAVNTLYYGRSTKGRDRQMVYQVKQLLERSDLKIGLTVIVETPRLGAVLHNLATSKRRKVVWLNPQLHLGVRNQLLWMDRYQENLMDQWIVDYERMIRNGYMVIIDLEPLRYFHRYDFAVSLVLWHLRIKLDKMFDRDRKPHALVVENTARHIDDLVFFLEYGRCYELSCLLWLDSPQFFKERLDRLALLEMSIHHTYLNARRPISDLPYYEQLFSEIPASILEDPSPEMMLYRLQGNDYVYYQGYAAEQTLSDEEFKRYRNNAKKSMTLLIKESTQAELAQQNQLEILNSDSTLDQLKALSYEGSIIPEHEQRQTLEELQSDALNQQQAHKHSSMDWLNDEF